MRIKNVIARQIFDSRGNPTVETKIITDQGTFKAKVPSGASTGTHEALELRDNGKRFHGKSVINAVKNVNYIIAPKLKGMNVDNYSDSLLLELDGTKNKSKLGANAILSVSIAMIRAKARNENMEVWEYVAKITNQRPKLPLPFSNVINGGVHAGNDLMPQEFMLVPQEKTFHENMMVLTETYHDLKELIKRKYGKNAINVGDEGGFAPPLKSAHEALDLLETVTRKSIGKFKFAMDVAASELKRENGYEIEKSVLLDQDEMIDYYSDLISSYDIISIEDPFAEDDFEGFKKFHKAFKIQVVGDDLLVTNPERIKFAIENDLVNALLLKVNQIGTVDEAIQAAMLSFDANWNVMVSHRSGETCDDFIADLAVGLGTGQIKTGGVARSERIAKYNRLLEIETELTGITYEDILKH